MRRFLVLAALLTTVALAAACGGRGSEMNRDTTPPGATGEATATGAGEIVPVPGNAELVVGLNRFILGLIDQQNRPVLWRPGVSVRLGFLGPDGAVLQAQDARFIWAMPDETGLWAVDVDFPEAGQWRLDVSVTRDGKETEASLTVAVLEEGTIPNVGDPAIPTTNPTLADVADIWRISTDRDPEPALYEMTVAEALQTDRPLVVVFATPAFCQDRFCGPVVDTVKEIRPEFAGRVSFVHIEPFELTATGLLVTDRTGAPVLARPMLKWNLRTEPWVFVVGADGLIAARFEGTVSPDELRDAIGGTLG